MAAGCQLPERTFVRGGREHQGITGRGPHPASSRRCPRLAGVRTMGRRVVCVDSAHGSASASPTLTCFSPGTSAGPVPKLATVFLFGLMPRRLRGYLLLPGTRTSPRRHVVAGHIATSALDRPVRSAASAVEGPCAAPRAEAEHAAPGSSSKAVVPSIAMPHHIKPRLPLWID